MSPSPSCPTRDPANERGGKWKIQEGGRRKKESGNKGRTEGKRGRGAKEKERDKEKRNFSLQKRSLRTVLYTIGKIFISPPHFLHKLRPPWHRYLGDLVDSAVNLVVEDASYEKRLDVGNVDVQLLSDEGNVDARVGLDQLDQHLRPDVAQQVLDMLSLKQRKEKEV